jgi:hypothetical protein
MESRDTRGQRNKKLAMLNYKLGYAETNDEGQQAEDKVEKREKEIERMKEIVFRGKPRRVYRSNKGKDVSFQDPKRVHTALREFNDMSANKVFANIIEQIALLENEEKAKQLQF